MYRMKDFKFVNAYDTKGRYLGFVDDIAIDYHEGLIAGVKLNKKGFFSKDRYILFKDIPAIDDSIISYKTVLGKYLCFNDIKSLEVIDKFGNIIGTLEDIIIDERNYAIKALIVNPGMIMKIVKGKEILLLKETILGDKYISYLGNRNRICFKSLLIKGQET